MFNKIFQLIFPLLVIYTCLSSVATAATVIKIQDGNEITTMLTDGKRARINMSADEYVIADYASSKISMVSPPKKQVMVFDVKPRGRQSSTDSSMVKVVLNNRGKSRNIAGYHSDRYEYIANGKNCGVVYASKSALQEKGVKQLLDTMQATIDQQRTLLGGFAAMIDDCKLADMELINKMGGIGVPMMKEENGRVMTQVKSIDIDVALPAEMFLVPSGYTRTGEEQQEQQAYSKPSPSQKQSPPAMPGRPDMSVPMSGQVSGPVSAPVSAGPHQQMPGYRQRPGQLSPEITGQMRRAQRMIQQYQPR